MFENCIVGAGLGLATHMIGEVSYLYCICNSSMVLLLSLYFAVVNEYSAKANMPLFRVSTSSCAVFLLLAFILTSLAPLAAIQRFTPPLR
jgi:hypothetical protein